VDEENRIESTDSEITNNSELVSRFRIEND